MASGLKSHNPRFGQHALQGWVYAPEDSGTRTLSDREPKAKALGYFRISLSGEGFRIVCSLQSLAALEFNSALRETERGERERTDLTRILSLKFKA